MEDKINRIDYETPGIIQEFDLEVKAGSPWISRSFRSTRSARTFASKASKI